MNVHDIESEAIWGDDEGTGYDWDTFLVLENEGKLYTVYGNGCSCNDITDYVEVKVNPNRINWWDSDLVDFDKMEARTCAEVLSDYDDWVSDLYQPRSRSANRVDLQRALKPYWEKE